MVHAGEASPGVEPVGSDRVFSLLDRVRREMFAARVLTGLTGYVGLLLGYALLLLFIELLLAPPAGVRLAALISFVLLAVAGAALLPLRRFFENPSDEEIALLIESHRGDLNNELINAVRFTVEPQEMEHPLVRAALAESGRRATDLDPRGVVSWRGFRRMAVLSGALAVAWALLLVIAYDRTANALLRLVNPSSNIGRLGRVRIVEVIPGDATVVLGDNLTIEAVLDGMSGADVAARLEHSGEDGPVQSEPMLRAEQNRYTAELVAIKAPRTYRVVVGGSQSRLFQIRVTERPLVTRVAAAYSFPAYTRRAPESVADTAGIIQALKGSKASLTIFSNKRLRSAGLSLGEGEPLVLGIASDGFSAFTRGPLLVADAVSGTLEIADEFGCKNSRSLRVVPIRDNPPQVVIASPGKDRSIGVGESLDLIIRGSDDYGVVRAELLARVVEEGQPEEAALVRAWDDFSDRRAVAIQWRWEFPPDRYRSGEVVRYFVKMVDGNDIDGPGVGVSPEFVVRLENPEERRREHEAKLSNWQAELMRVLEQQRELRRQTDLIVPLPSSREGDAK